MKRILITGMLMISITMLSQDIMKVPEDQILDTTVEYTIIGGKIRYARR